MANSSLLPPSSETQSTISQPSAKPKMHLYDLPTEIKCGILSKLPVRQIQCTRKVSKHLRDLIDNPKNRSLLVKPASNAVARIQDIHDHVFNFASKKFDLLLLVIRLNQLLGRCCLIPWVVARLWFLSLGIDLKVATTPLLSHQCMCLRTLVTYITILLENRPDVAGIFNVSSAMRLCRSKDGWMRLIKEDRYDTFHSEWYEDFNLSEEHFSDIYDRAVEFKQNSLQSLKRYTVDGKLAFVDVDQSRLCELLQVPVIPEFAKNMAFRYAVKSQWAYGTVLAILQGQTNATDLQLAAIRQEAFLTLVTESIDLRE